MSEPAQTFSLGREAAEDGSFRRQESRFRRWVTADGSSGFAPVAGRYHLYVSRACPWAHRTMIARVLMGLQQAISISLVDPIAEYEHLWPYLRDLYQCPGVAATVDFGEIRTHYYRTHPMINPSGLVAVMPALDFDAPHGRASLSATSN